MSNEDLREMKYEMEREMIEDQAREISMRNDWEFALEQLGVSPEMTVKEFAAALRALQALDWGISADELLETILED